MKKIINQRLLLILIMVMGSFPILSAQEKATIINERVTAQSVIYEIQMPIMSPEESKALETMMLNHEDFILSNSFDKATRRFTIEMSKAAEVDVQGMLDSYKAVAKENASKKLDVNSLKGKEFPQMKDTGDPDADQAAYYDAKGKWIKDNPDAYKKMVTESGNSNSGPSSEEMEKARKEKIEHIKNGTQPTN